MKKLAILTVVFLLSMAQFATGATEEQVPLQGKKIALVIAPGGFRDEEYQEPKELFETLGGNVLAVAPKKCIALAGNPMTAEKLRLAGIELFTYPGEDISIKGSGGPTCLSCPILRQE